MVYGTKYSGTPLVSWGSSTPCNSKRVPTGPAVPYKLTRQTFSNREVVAGSPNKNWELLIESGADVTSQYYKSVERVSSRDGALIGYDRDYNRKYKHFGAVNPGSIVTPESLRTLAFDSAGAENDARADFYNNIAEITTTFSGLNFAATLKDTIHGIRHPADALVKQIAKYRAHAARAARDAHGSGITKREATKVVADLWLEYKFGWAPLIDDIDAGVEALAQSVVGIPQWYPVTGKGKSSSSTSTSIAIPSVDMGGKGFTCVGNNVTVVSLEKTVKYFCLVKAPEPKSLGALDHFGVGLNAFVPTLWDLTPYSFLVDYFSNVGDVINAYTIIMPTAKRFIRTSKEKRKSNTIGTVAQSFILHEITSGDLGALITTADVFERTIPVSVPMPYLEFDLPKVDSVKWINIAALLAGRL